MEVNSDHLRAIIEANPLKTTGEIAEELNIDHSMIILVFEANWKSEKLHKRVPDELTENKKKLF